MGLVILASATVGAQVRFEVPLMITDGIEADTLYFGILPGAVFGISPSDSINGHSEFELPPFPPTGVFETRFVWPRSGGSPEPPAGFGQGSPNDYRPFLTATQRDTFRAKCQLGQGVAMMLSWPAGLSSRFTQLTLRYFDGTQNVNIDMLTNTSANITDAGDPALANIYSGGLVTPVTPPPAPDLVSPPDGAVNVSLQPTLTWNTASTATAYRLQVAQDSLFGLPVFDDSTLTGTSRQVGPLAQSTLYYWRVRGKNSGGSGPYSSTFRFTTTQTPPAPVLISPADSATRVPSSSTFVWSLVGGATSYHLQIATEPTFTSLVVNDSTISNTTRTVSSLPYSAILMWRVRARNSSGASEFSPPRVFTVMQEPPSVPTQVTPTNNQSGVTLDVLFRWTNAVLAAGYHLQVAHDTLMTNMFLDDTSITDSSRNVRVAPSTAYYWRVRARNLEQTYGAFSPVHRFTSATVPPAIPIPTYPANGDTGVARNVTLLWLASPGALLYRAQVSTNISFTQIIADDSTLTASQFSPGILPSRVSCYWRVRAQGMTGASPYCSVQSFRTGSLIVSVDPGPREGTPTGFVLHQNYPNPFNPSTSIPFEISEGAFVTLKIYDILGREIQTLMNQELPAGVYTVRWNGQNDNGQPMPSGMYLVRMTANGRTGAGTFAGTRKILLLK